MYVAISLHTKFGAYYGQGREGKGKQQGKVSPRVVVSDWKSLSGCHVPSTVSSSTTLRTPVTIVTCPVDAVSVRVH